jgi:hypothetical protein
VKCLIIVGPAAAGKMTIGRAIAEKTGYKLLHNHMTIDLLLNIFEHGSKQFWKLDQLFRFSIMKEVAKSQLPGFIFTFLWGFNCKDDEKYIQKIEKIFSDEGAETIFLELECSLEERKKRNKTALRLEHKPSKRDTKYSEKIMVQHDKKYRCNSLEGEFKGRKHLKLNNENLRPEEAADRAIKYFQL